VSQERILVPSAKKIVMLRERRHVKENDTRGNSSMGQGVKSQRQKVLQGLHIRHASKFQLRETWIRH
jgi:hypothetical protein